ncbi:MAG TPA: serine/threonine-protein kinase, partial [Kofleriaceae bacterium]|nr:serine/threonine-protein kinase [Kofleriaceae bacterium]
MRMVDGRTLVEAIASVKSFAARLALLPAVIAATEAVAFAHAQRVIHRDLTPSNILVGAYGETVVIDWGLAKDLADGSDTDEDAAGLEGASERLTGVGAVIGTAAYMPPEQAHAIPVDERADVYALGAILYHLCAGVPPYRGTTAKELLRAVKTAAPPRIDRVQPGTPRDLVSIIDKAMCRDPDARYPSARELAEELARFQTGRLVEAHVYSRVELAKRFLRKHRAVVTAMALAVAIGAAFGTIAVGNILSSRADAQSTVRELILEKGRIELLEGNAQRALAYLWEAHQRGDDSPMLQVLLGHALRALSTSERTLDCGGSRVQNVAFDRAGVYVAAACHEVARVWRLADGQEIAKLEGDDAGFDGVRFSSDGTLLATWGESGIARVWRPEARTLVAAFDHGSAEKLASHRALLAPLITVDAAPVEINRASFTPDGKRLATTGADGLALIWDIPQRALVRTLVGSAAVLRDLSSLYGWFSRDGARLYAMTPDGVGHGWDVATGAALGKREHGSFAMGGDLSADDAYGVSCGMDGRVRVWDLEAGTLRHQFAAHTDPTWKCIFSPDSRLVLSGGHDGRANIYELANGQMVTTVQHGDVIINADISPDSRRFATIDIGGHVKIWDTRTGMLVANLDTVRGKDAHFAPDNEHLVAARGDGRIQIWKFEPPAEHAAPADVTLGIGGTHMMFSAAVSGAMQVRVLVARRDVPVALTLGAPQAIAERAAIVAGTTARGVRVVDLAGKA